ncbi:hypothetical protein CYMTET_36896 [Cymbomonas tetramitiformis]|uniref:Uncharacterized protein n=1 Tax=Cymbomonas tetramitiformis TaxID=36881 RepID=A0AAE0CF27_9CHLO|nr:hypothetical protein CYMTET_36896 [Cymbomonas tetramitiformis]
MLRAVIPLRTSPDWTERLPNPSEGRQGGPSSLAGGTVQTLHGAGVEASSGVRSGSQGGAFHVAESRLRQAHHREPGLAGKASRRGVKTGGSASQLRSAQPSAAAVVTWRISRWLHDGFTRVNYARRSLRREARRRGATDGTGMGQRKGMAVAAGKASLEPLDDLQIWMEVPGPTAKLIADSGNPCAGLRR